jgi:hypothetical protein
MASRTRSIKAAFRFVWADRIYVEIDDLDAALVLAVAVSGMPRSVAETNIADLGEPETAPLTSRRQTLAALSTKLIGQRFFLPS